MSATTTPVNPPIPNKPAADPGIFKILDDGTVLYKTYQQAESAAKQIKADKQGGDATKKLSQVKYGESYLSKDGQVIPYTLGSLVEFQLTGLIVVLIVLVGLSLICAAIGRLITKLDRTKAIPPVPVTSPPLTVSGIHPGLSDQQLVVLLTAAASEVIGAPVRIAAFRPLAAKDSNWATQGRKELQSHRLK